MYSRDKSSESFVTCSHPWSGVPTRDLGAFTRQHKYGVQPHLSVTTTPPIRYYGTYISVRASITSTYLKAFKAVEVAKSPPPPSPM